MSLFFLNPCNRLRQYVVIYMQIVVNNVAILLVFAFVGWLLTKAKIISGQHAGVLSALEVWVFLPCKSFLSVASDFTLEYISENYLLIVVSTGVLAALLLMSRVLAPKLSAEGYERSVVFYSLTIPNIGYAGYALAEGIYGERMLLNALIFGLPMSFWIYSEGYRMLMNSGRVSLRRFFNPCIIGMLIGCIFGLTNLRVPTLVQSVASQASGCMAPVSMLLLGITIADYDLSEILRNKRAYVISALRLLVIPLVLCVVLSRFLPEQIVLVAVLLYCMPCGLNTVVFPKLIGEDCRLGASLSLISSLFAILTIPFCLQAVAWMY